MKTPLLLLTVAWLCLGGRPAHATLGERPSQYPLEGTDTVHQTLTDSLRDDGRVTVKEWVDTRLSRHRIREYVADGKVFAVVWSGYRAPHWGRLLGKYARLVADSRSAERGHRGRHSGLAVHRPEITFEQGGPMRSVHGRAYLPAKLPPGFTAGEIR